MIKMEDTQKDTIHEDTIQEDIPVEEVCETEAVDTECDVEESTSDDVIKGLKDQIAAEKEKLLRTAAEYANFRSRTEREKLSIYSNAVSDTIKELLPIADSLDRAKDNAISSVDSEDMESDTIAMVYQKGYKVGDKIIRHCMVQTVN